MDWLKGLGMDIIVLNVAGPRESKAPGIQESARAFISRRSTLCERTNLNEVQQMTHENMVQYRQMKMTSLLILLPLASLGGVVEMAVPGAGALPNTEVATNVSVVRDELHLKSMMIVR